MKRAILLLLLAGVLPAASVSAAAPAADTVGAEANRLEVDLTRYKDTSPEAGDILAKLVDLYRDQGRPFGLVRAGHKFITLHSGDSRHKAVMLQLIDGIEALSRNEDLAAICRQFLERYPNEPEAAAVEIRLARTLDRMPDRLRAAMAWRAVWQRQSATPAGRRAAARAMTLYEALATVETVAAAESLAEEMIAKLPADPLTGQAGYRAFGLLCRGGRLAPANTLAVKTLAKGGLTDPVVLRELYTHMAANYHALGQYANAAESLRKAIRIQETPEACGQLIQYLCEANASPVEIQAAADNYLQKYPSREDRFDRLLDVGRAYERAKDSVKALAIYRSLVPDSPVAGDSARGVLALAAKDAAGLAQIEHLLQEIVQRNPRQADLAAVVLATEVYGQRMHDRAKARQFLQDYLAGARGEDGYAMQAFQWLLTTAQDEAEFRAAADRLLSLRRQSPEKPCHRDDLAWLIQALRADPKKKSLAAYLEDGLHKLKADPIAGLWFSQRSWGGQEPDDAVRAKLLAPAMFDRLSSPLRLAVASQQAEFLRGANQVGRRAEMIAAYVQWCKLAPGEFAAVAGRFNAVFDQAKPEAAQQELLTLLKLEPPPAIDGDTLYRMLAVAARLRNLELGRTTYAWVAKAMAGARYPIVDSRIGNALRDLGLEKEAIDYWKWGMAVNRDDGQSWYCASQLRGLAAGAQRMALDKELAGIPCYWHGHYVSWLAEDFLAAHQPKDFEQVLGELKSSEESSMARDPEVDTGVLAGCVAPLRDDKDMSDAERRAALAALRDLNASGTSAMAHVLLLDMGEAEKMSPMERLLAYQAATRLCNMLDTGDCWRLVPLAQSLMDKKDYAAAATLLTGLLANIPNASDVQRAPLRAMAAQCYAQIGAVGMIIDDRSQSAPLVHAALYLRLGDERLAMETFAAERALFAAHRQEMSPELLIFVTQRLIAAGGDDNLNDVELWLREWIMRNGDSKQFDDSIKAQVQLLLAKGCFKAQRYDVARTEFTTVINRFPKAGQAMDAQFGIGETYLAQKIYDQALAVFDRLAASHDAEVVVRAEFLRGVVAFQRGDTDEARELFRAVLDRVPSIELADKALFRLSEIYGMQERYLEQLTLLRTVGRLGRTSKRTHVPGQPLAIVVYDSDLGISRGHNRIPVIVTTEPGGDRELVYLTSAGAGRGLFRADLDTRLGKAVPNNRILELTGRDTIHCDYPPEFRAQFRRVPLSDVQIQVASDGKLEVASTKDFELKKATFSEELQKEAQQPLQQSDPRVSQVRPINQIKPGNPIYVRVTDPDRDLTDERDEVIVKLAADSGDEVQVKLKETGPHTGVFEGVVQTGELPAGAMATDSAIDHGPLLAIDHDPKSYWQSEPDGRTPKVLSIDMKDLRRVARVRVTVPDPTNRAPARAELQGSYDGAYWFRLGGYPGIGRCEPVAGSSGRMKRRVYAGNYTGLREWQQVVQLTQQNKAVEEAEADELTWSKPQDATAAAAPYAVVFSGKLVQARPGAARILVAGGRTALAIDGREELPLGNGTQYVDVWLSAGSHNLTVFAAAADGRQVIGATWARADLSSARIALHPFHATDFDLSLPEASQASAPAPEAELTRGDRTWDFRFPAVPLRHVRFLVHEYLGDAVAVSNMEVFGEKPDELFIPPAVDLVALANNDILEIAGGDVVTATYIDEVVPGDSGRPKALTATLTATYFNADISPITYDFAKAAEGGVDVRTRRVLRIGPGERFVVQIRDYDEDRTNERDTVPLEVAVNDGKPVPLVATETLPNSGVFTKEIDTSSADEKEKLTVKPGDRIFCRYVDKQNTFPGHSVVREMVVLVNQATAARMRILDTVVTPPAVQSKDPPKISYRRPPAGRDIANVALAGPLTIEVIDPDAAKDTESSVIVSVGTAGGPKLDVRCVLPRNNQGSSNNDDALAEGRFVGQVLLQLGGKGSSDIVPLTTGLSPLIGGPVIEEQTPNTVPTVTRALNLTGKDPIAAVYHDQRRPDGKPAELSVKARLSENGQLFITDRDYERPVDRLYLGERLYLKVIDADRDATDDRDKVAVEITASSGERETVTLEETLPHSGVFTGSFLLKAVEKPTPGNFEPANPVIEAYFGDTIRVKYDDPAALTESGRLEVVREVPVAIGTNGEVAAFSKAFSDEKLAAETRFAIAESHFELFKNHKKLERKEDAKADLEAGRLVLRELMEEHPEPKYAPRIAYLLGQFAQELGQWDEAINAYQSILRQYAEHALAADAQYKLAQCYDEMGDFDLALEAYVTLAATYPKSPLVASVMIRIADQFYKKEKFDVSAQVCERFVEKFEGHPQAARMAFRVGQSHYKAGKFKEAGKAFDHFARTFAEDKLAAEALFWAGESYRMGGNGRMAFQRYNRCRWDFPASEAAKYARGRLALPEMILQFESESQNLSNPDEK